MGLVQVTPGVLSELLPQAADFELKFMSQGAASIFPFPSLGTGRRYVCGYVRLELWLGSEYG